MKKLVIALFVLMASYCNAQDATALFESSKGKWSFPVSAIVGIDTTAFDCSHYPGKSLYLTIQSQKGINVHSVQEGKVVAISEVGASTMIIVATGDYFLVYDGLTNPQITKGSVITKKSIIGQLAENELNLILMKGPKTININRWFDWNQLCSNSPESKHPEVSL